MKSSSKSLVGQRKSGASFSCGLQVRIAGNEFASRAGRFFGGLICLSINWLRGYSEKLPYSRSRLES